MSEENLKRRRSEIWFNDKEEPGETAVYLERYPSWGLTRGEMQSGKPVIGIAQSGSELTPCNRIHLALAARIKDGIRDAGGIPFEFPIHPIQESCRRPTAALDRNLAYLGLVEIMLGYPFDGVVLTTACDKTTPACLMAAATVNMPAIVLSGGPMIDSYTKSGKLAGSGMVGVEHLPPNFGEAGFAPAPTRAGGIAATMEANGGASNELQRYLDEANTVRVEVGTTVDEAERQLILKTLLSTHNNKTKAAEILGISSKTLQNKLKEYSNAASSVME